MSPLPVTISLAIAKAEQNYFASNGKYTSLEDLRTSGELTLPIRAGYSYSGQASDAGFKITAQYSGRPEGAKAHL